MGEVHRRELQREVVDSGLCTGCAACVMTCRRDVLGCTEDYFPGQIGEGMAHDQCTIGDRGCDICTRACPRFRNWESDIDEALFGRPRTADEVCGQACSILLTRTTDAAIAEVGRDDGLVSALSVWGSGTERIEDAVTSRIVNDGRGPFDAEPFLATTRAGVLATAGSRYTYPATPLAMKQADEAGLIEARPGEHDPVAMSLLAELSGWSRKRWPSDGLPAGARAAPGKLRTLPLVST